jgi:hypothetical protein
LNGHRTGCWTRLAQLVAGGLALLFVVVTPPTLVARGIASQVFSADILKQELTDRLVNSGALRQAVVRRLLPSGDATAGIDFLGMLTANLSQEELGRITTIAVPDDWVSGQIDGLVDALFAWLDGDQLVPQIQVDVEPIKRNLVGAGTEAILDDIVDSWPDCSLEQLAQLELAFEQGGDMPMLFCQPPEPIRSVLIGFAADLFRAQARLLPARLELAEQVPPSAAADLLRVKRTMRAIRLGGNWSFAVPIILLGLIVTAVVRSWGALARWWGLPLLVAGVLTVALAIVLVPLSQRWLAQVSVGATAGSFLLEAWLDVLGDLARGGLLRAAILGGIAALLGALMLALGWLLPTLRGRQTGSSQPSGAGGQPPTGMFG